MEKWQQYFVIMAALSSAAQKLTEQAVKNRLLNELGTTQSDPVKEARRELWLHIVSGVIGILLCLSIQIDPILLLQNGQSASPPPDALSYSGHLLLTGVLVSFGGSFFNDLLGALREFKDAQSELQKQLSVQNNVVAAGAGVDAVVPEVASVRDLNAEGFDISYFDRDIEGNAGQAPSGGQDA